MISRPLAPRFYARPTPEVARRLLGRVVVSQVGGRRTAGRIVETEAYIGQEDQACHARFGETKRARILSFGSTALLFAAGLAVAAGIGSTAGQVVGFVMMGIALVTATSLVFLEVGLSEDRQRDREERRGEAREASESERSRDKPPSPRLRRTRGERRRLS